MRKIYIVILLLIVFKGVFAHNPQVSTLSIIQNHNNKWSVFITAPLSTCQLAITANFPKMKPDSIDPLTLQKGILELVKNSFIINGDKIIDLQNPKIQLAHETTIYFELNDSEGKLELNNVDFSAFSKLHDHVTLLKIVPIKEKEVTYILNSENRYAYGAIKEIEPLKSLNFNKYIVTISGIGMRYFLIAGMAFLIFYILLKRKLFQKKIQIAFPGNSDYVREIFFSSTTILIFGCIVVSIVYNPAVMPYTKFYTALNERGWFYYFAIFLVLIIIHDTYFYWTHRLMHQKNIFKYFHLVHHKSTNPSPWAAYSFHPLEAIVENGIFIILIFSIPLHKSHIFVFFLFSIIYNIYGHLGWELYPKGFSKSFIGKWINTSVSHNQHHKYFKGNYGLYFLFWDRIMGTLRADYDVAFEEVKNR